MLRRPLVLGGVVLLALPAVAQAHSGAGSATNYRITIAGLRPALGPAEFRVYGGDDRIELRWDGRPPLTVLGYAGEPYLRLGPGGAFESRRSPSASQNTARFGVSEVDPHASATAPPEWRRISSQPVAVWHDHRTHWMSRTPPAVVGADPGRDHLVERWTVPVRVAGRPARIVGRLDWLAPPSPWPWVALLLVGALLLAVVALRGARRPARAAVRAAALGAVAAGAAAAAASALDAPSEGLTTGIGSALGPVPRAGLWSGAAFVALVAWLLVRRRGSAVEAAVLLAAAWLVGGGALLGQIGALNHAVVPSELPAVVVRLAVALGLAALAAPTAWAWRLAGDVRARGRPRTDLV
jgi:hypothetical protein